MKKLIFYLFSGLIFLGLSSCDRVKTEKIRSFVVSYNSMDGIRLDTLMYPSIYIQCNKIVDNVDWKSKGDDKIKYDALCTKHNDTGYYKKISYIAYPMLGHYFMDDITAIDIVSDKDFDAGHPAGTSLKDVVRFCSASPYKFIQSGYKMSYDWSNLPKGYTMDKGLTNLITAAKNIKNNYQNDFDLKENYPIDNVLSELKPEDLKLLGFGNGLAVGVFIFESKPAAVPATHTLTIRFTTETGKTLVADMNYNFR